MPEGFTENKSEEIRKMIYGLDTLVEIDDGKKMVPAINLDNGATTPPFKLVNEKILKELLNYGSIGRGTGQKSVHTSEVYIAGREKIKQFVGAKDDKYEVIYTNCTTDGMNKLASALIDSHRDIVLTTRMEHHANDLPWRERARTVYAEVGADGKLILEDFERLLKEYTNQSTGEHKIKYVAVTAASNVTGYVNEVHDIAEIAHRYNAKIIVDGAQIVAHRQFSMLGDPGKDNDIDFLVFSAHKMYSPYGGGVIVGLKEELNRRLPVFYGGGMVDRVVDNDVDYSAAPDRYEAGSPNYPGVVGMLEAMRILTDEIGFEYIEKHEQILLKRAIEGFKSIPAAILYGDVEDTSKRVGTIVFNLKDIENGEVAKKLADHSAIAVRHAKFCAHTYVNRLLGLNTAADSCIAHTGMVRASFGVYNNEKDVDALLQAIEDMLRGDRRLVFTVGKLAGSADTLRLPNDRG